MKFKSLSIIFLTLLLTACGNDTMPKPAAHLRLEYPKAEYKKMEAGFPFTFEKNELATQFKARSISNDSGSYGIDIKYPSLKGTIYLTYKPINNSKERLTTLLRDAQGFTQEHTVKADAIVEQLYANKDRSVYGMFYEVGGNAASQSQFYVTDSINHFLTGSLYFYAKPNFDSILPAAKYLQKDIQQIMETITWK
ncbi:gliding motility lipoprotein GldD [Bizionia argentinensis JUB59]|uniref:Gliding motility lipoprotein GldD n=1 Tax=Bizionia argentinensis JUB59 TaxID=1046627 RepID=G2EHB7_9FLAO|nr:gliding motility lipoprotein GldD [Bizionia argentinensis]EGV42179.1 gliding motility lipoprotein GldD [Bizionia argentinensis JUB59]